MQRVKNIVWQLICMMQSLINLIANIDGMHCVINNSEFANLPTGELRALHSGDVSSICGG